MKRTLAEKAQFYQQLYAGYKAGLPMDVLTANIIELLATHTGKQTGKTGAQSTPLQTDISRGKSLSSALLARKLISRWEAQLLKVGENAGRLETVLLDLQIFYEDRNRQFHDIRSRLLYPVIVLLFAIFIPPLPQLASGTLSIIGYLFITVGKSLLLYALIQLLFIKPFIQASHGAFNPILLRALKIVGSNHKIRLIFEVSYLNLLSLCLESGMDAVQSLKQLREGSTLKTFRSQHRRAIRCIEQHGDSLSDTLSSTGILCHYEVCAFLRSSEASGTLHSDLRLYVMRKKSVLQTEINFHIQRLSKWFYVLTLLYVTANII